MATHYLESDLFRDPVFISEDYDDDGLPADPPPGAPPSFAEWLGAQLQPLTAEGFQIGEAIEEDYGCGLWAEHGKTPFWIALSFVGSVDDKPEPAVWLVSVDYDPGLNLLKRLFHRPDPEVQRKLETAVSTALTAEPAIRILTEEEWNKLGEGGV